MKLRTVGKVLVASVAGFLGLILILMLAVGLALDRAPIYQAEIKEWVHKQIGYPIAFAHVSPAFRWYGPELYFEQLELRSKDDQRVLARAAGGRIGLDIWQLLHTGKLLAGRIELKTPKILIARIGPNKFALASELALGGGNSALATLTLEDFPAGTLAIRHGFITVQNWNDALPQLALEDVSLEARRGDEGMTLKLTSRLPADLGGVISVNGKARGLGELDTLDWNAVIHATDIDFSGWRKLLPDYLRRLESGTGAFELVARGQGADVIRADLDFGAKSLVTHQADGPYTTFEEVSGTVTATHTGERWHVLGKRLHAARAGRHDRDSEFDLSWHALDAGLVEVAARASYLRLDTLWPLTGLLPEKSLRDRLQELALSGEWFDTQVHLQRAAPTDPWRLNVNARFHDMGFAAVGKAPGLRGLSGSITGNDAGGRVAITSDRAVFSWPIQFSQPVSLETLKSTFYWKRTPDELLVATPAFDIKNPDASVHGLMAWRQPSDGGSPILTLSCSVDNGNVANAPLYLPRGFIAPSALNWLNRAFVEGHLSHADAVVQGPVKHFPFRDGTGLFLVRSHLSGVTLDYREAWPRAEGLDMRAEFRNEGMSVQLLSGRIGNLRVEGGTARFVDFKTAELQLHAVASGDAADALGYMRATPIDALAEHAFSNVEARGPMQSTIDLFFPFKEFEHRRILVHNHFSGVALNKLGSPQAATEVVGDADVEGAQVARADLHGKLLGGAFQMQARAARTRPLTRTVLVFSGMFSAEALHDALALPAGVVMGGQADWRAVLKIASDPRERTLRVNSNLAGLDLDLPAPLAKPAGEALPSVVDVDWPAAGGTEVRVALGAVLRGALNLNSESNGSGVSRAAVSFGSNEPSFSDSQVVNTDGRINRLDLAGWLKLYTPDKAAKPLTDFLRTAKLEVSQLDYLGFSFLDVALELAVKDGDWRINIGGPNVIGSITVPGPAQPAAPWQLAFERLKFIDGPTQPGDGGARNGALPNNADPRAIPAISFHAGDMVWGGRQLGDVDAQLVKFDDGIGLTQLTMTSPTFAANATGDWRGKEAGVGHVTGSILSTDVGATLKELGYAAVIEAKTGKMDFDMSWLGAPSGPALSLATGHVQLALDKGQITGLDPGAGRVVGLASIAALPRRLALDFSDLTDKGFAFDTARGDFELREGSVFTDNILVNGPAAEIGLIGRVGLKNRDYDQTAVVTGNVGSSIAIPAFVGGPVVGAVALLFTQVFKQPLRGLARGYYRITGSWASPTVERIKSADAAAAPAEAPK